ncbi:MAG TPA: hypothetical protein DCP28_09875 [Cytophagales bacterium]|nr:hypothetical protein [Cytophagales bacterium]
MFGLEGNGNFISVMYAHLRRSGWNWVTVIVLMFWSHINPITAQITKALHDQLYLVNYTPDQGLSEASVNTFLVDHQGIMWIGTDGGLNRFNGYEFTPFIKSSDTSSISNNSVMALTEDGQGTLWAGTWNGLNAFDPVTQTFQRYTHPNGSGNYAALHYDSARNYLWGGTRNLGMVVFDITQRKFLETPEYRSQNEYVEDLIPITQDSLLVATRSHGLMALHLPSGRTGYLTEKDGLLSNAVSSLAFHGDWLLVGTQVGAQLWNLKSGERTVYNRPEQGIPKNYVVCATADSQGNFWLGTDGGGVVVITPTTGTAQNYQRGPLGQNTLQSNVVRDLYFDGDENLWIGTYKQGFGIHRRSFRRISHVIIPESLKTQDAENFSVSAFHLASDGWLYIGTDGSGLLRWDGVEFERISLQPSGVSSYSESILSITEDSQGYLYFGTYGGGLIRRSPAGEVYRYTDAAGQGFADAIIWNFAWQDTTRLWMATFGGLVCLDLETQAIHSYLQDTNPYTSGINILYDVEVMPTGEVWAVSSAGYFVLDPEKEEITQWVSQQHPEIPLPLDFLVSMHRDRDGLLWLGSFGEGIYITGQRQKAWHFQDLTRRVGNKFVYFINEDGRGVVWLGTNWGVAGVDKYSGDITWLNAQNGLAHGVFNLGASLVVQDSILIAGGVNGIHFINTYQAREGMEAPRILLESARLDEELIPLKREHLTEPINIEVPYGPQTLSLNYAALDFGDASNIRYEVWLKGDGPALHQHGSQRQVSYMNLDPGTYTLEVKASYQNSLEFPPQQLVTIHVVPPLYMTNGFRIAIVLLLVICIWGFIRLRTRTLHQHRKRLRSAVQEQTKLLNQQQQEIKEQNDELIVQNEELISLNEELQTQREVMSVQQNELERAHANLLKINDQLELMVSDRTEQLKRTIDELNKTISELDRFVYSASHDLGAPLKSLLGLIHIARIECKDSGLEQHLDFMESSVLKLEEVIKSLIHYSRNSRLEVVPEPVSLVQLVDSEYDSLRYLPGHQSVEMRNEIPKGSIVISDLGRLRMILRNLLSNAIKYADLDKPNPYVHVRFARQEYTWSLEIEDNGQGIPATHERLVFDMFVRANEKADGSGLGLYIARESAQKLGGELSLSSEEGAGTLTKLVVPTSESAPPLPIQLATSSLAGATD